MIPYAGYDPQETPLRRTRGAKNGDACRRGHKYRPGSFRVIIVRGYVTRSCRLCLSITNKLRYQNNPEFRAKQIAKVKANQAKKKITA